LVGSGSVGVVTQVGSEAGAVGSDGTVGAVTPGADGGLTGRLGAGTPPGIAGTPLGNLLLMSSTLGALGADGRLGVPPPPPPGTEGAEGTEGVPGALGRLGVEGVPPGASGVELVEQTESDVPLPSTDTEAEVQAVWLWLVST